MSTPISLNKLVRDFINGKPLPRLIGNQPLAAWLESLHFDHREFAHPDIAVALSVPTERPFVSEVAAALSFRIEEANTL